MHFKQGYFEEEELGKPYDLKMFKRLRPFVSPYRRFIIGSVCLIVAISLIDLSIPYISKIAIDRYMMPREVRGSGFGVSGNPSPRTAHPPPALRVGMTDADVATIVRKYPLLFRIEGNDALIPYKLLPQIQRKDLVLLRKKDLHGVFLAGAVFILAIIINFCLNFIQVMIMEYTGQKVMYDLRVHLFSHIQSLSVSFFTHNPVGRLVTRVTNDVQNMQEVFSSMIVLIFKDLLLIGGVTIILIRINWKLAAVSFAVIPLIFFASLYFAKCSRESFRILKVKLAEINTRFSETIGGIKIIQLFMQEMKNYAEFEKLNHEHYIAGIEQVRIFAMFLRFMGFLDAFVIALVIFYGGSGVLAGTLTLGELVAFLAYMKMFFSPIQDIAQKYNVMQNAMASAERIFQILDSKEKLPEIPLGPPLEKGETPNPPFFKGGQGGFDSATEIPLCPPLEKGKKFLPKISTLEMENIRFSYVDKEMVLKGVSFKVRAGESIAIVGPTGSGKTSLINLMIRFYDPASGRVLINGEDVKTSDIFALRSKMALVTQDPFLFSGTIRHNIFQGNGNFSQERIAHILKASNCDMLVNKLSKGIDTELSEGGASISSGERQLISIARAFARDPDLILLDEATSYIDSETESKIQEALTNLMQNRTSVIVAHRLSTARHADRIIVLHRGRIIESGTHEELMARKGFYFKLNLLQN
jgi:ATP-binding cassette subfamily B protein